MTTEAMREFGVAVRQQRLDLGWNITKLTEELYGSSDRKGYVGQVEKGRKNLSPETIDKFVQTLDLPDDVAKAALIGPAPEQNEPEETKLDLDAAALLRRAQNDPTVPVTGERLLIDLAYRHAEGKFRDLFDAYNGLRDALEAAEDIRKRGTAAPSNEGGGMVERIMAEVAARNEVGEIDEAGEYLDQETKRLTEQYEQIVEQQLKQDQLRNRPDLAAKRIVARFQRQEPKGGVWNATNDFIFRNNFGFSLSMYDVRVHYELAKINRAKAKGRQKPASDFVLGTLCALLGESLRRDTGLRNAVKLFDSAHKGYNKLNDTLGAARSIHSKANAIYELAFRNRDTAMFELSIELAKQSLKHFSKDRHFEAWASNMNTLAFSYGRLGEMNDDLDQLETALNYCNEGLSSLADVENATFKAGFENASGLVQLWIGTLKRDDIVLAKAEDRLLVAIDTLTDGTPPRELAALRWNLADLNFARFELTLKSKFLEKARGFVTQAKAAFEKGGEYGYQVERCDELLAKIGAAENNLV